MKNFARFALLLLTAACAAPGLTRAQFSSSSAAPVIISTAPYTISKPGNYQLGGDLSSTATGLTLLTTGTGTVTSIDSDEFITVSINPTTVPGSTFFVGYSINHPAGTNPAGLDETTDAQRSFIAGDNGTDAVDLANLNDNDISPTSLDSINFPGNWLLRADVVPEPSTWAPLGLGMVGLGMAVSRRRRVG